MNLGVNLNRRLCEKSLRLIEYCLFHNGIKCMIRPDPVALRIMTGRCLELLRRLVVNERANIELINEDSPHFRTIPFTTARRDVVVAVKTPRDFLYATSFFGEFPEYGAVQWPHFGHLQQSALLADSGCSFADRPPKLGLGFRASSRRSR